MPRDRRGRANQTTAHPAKPNIGANSKRQSQSQRNADTQRRIVDRQRSGQSFKIHQHTKHHTCSAACLSRDATNLSGPFEFMLLSGVYVVTCLAIFISSTRWIAPLAGDYIPLPWIHMEPGRIGVVRSFDQTPVNLLWSVAAFTTCVYFLGLIVQDTPISILLQRLPKTFCSLWNSLTDLVQPDEWPKGQLAAYKVMNARGRAENRKCLSQFWEVPVSHKLVIWQKTVQSFWQELVSDASITMNRERLLQRSLKEAQ